MARTYLIVIIAGGVFSAVLNTAAPRSSDSSGNAFAERVKYADDSEDADSEASDFSGTPGDGEVRLERSDDGHFYADVRINGASVRALVDTGASGIALSREDARRAGLATSIGMTDVVGKGADGDVRGEYVELERVSLGDKTAEDMRAIVLNSGDMTLLGQSFLSKFDSVRIEGDRMILR